MDFYFNNFCTLQTVNNEESSEESSDEEDEEESQSKSIAGKRKTENNEEIELKVKKPNNYNNFVKAGQNNSFNGQNVSTFS